ncbi:DJ-1/PfpI family protein [Algoriphagus lacus]|nr:DJ-1/PfpI family protein [Algoriphagus lacus]
MKRRNIITTVFALFISMSTFAQNGKVLFVLSEADTLLLKKGKKKRQTGVFLNEFYFAHKAISDAGFDIDYATPTGKKATIDQESIDDEYWKGNLELKPEAMDFWENNNEFSNPMPLEKALEKQDEYMALVIPGGQGLMVDLIYDSNTPALLKAFAEDKKAIGLICHAPALITTIPKNENPFVGYTVNSVSPFEEFYIEKFIMKGKPKNRKIAKQLKNLALEYENGGPGKGFARRDRNLVTSQNPYSSEEFNELFLKLLGEMK